MDRLLCLSRSDRGGARVRASGRERITALPALLPPMGIFLVVVGSICAGLATPTEATSLGVTAALLLAAANRTLIPMMLRTASQAMAEFVTDIALSRAQTMLLLICVLVAIGFFLDTLSILLTAAPLITPIVIQLGYDPVWFGVLLMVLLETAFITPPVGINLYLVQGVRQRGEMLDLMKGAAPFVVTMLIMIALLLFPDLALWFPRLVY